MNNKEKSTFRLVNSLQNKHYLYLFVFAVVAILAIIFSLRTGKDFPFNSEKNTPFNTNWQYSVDDGNFQALSLPANLKEDIGQKVVLKTILPSKAISGATLLLRTSQQTMQVYVDDVLLYDCSGVLNDDPLPTSAYFFVRLPSDYINKALTLVLQSPYPDYAGLLNPVFIGSKASNLFYIMNKYGLQFIIGAFLFLVGFLFLFAFLFLAKHNPKIINFIYLGGFFTSSGFWVMSESRLLQFFIPIPAIFTTLGIYSLTLMPICLGMYYYKIYVRKYYKPLQLSIFICCGLSVIIAVISLINPLLPLASLQYYTVFLALHVIIILVTVFMEYRSGEKKLISSIWGIVIFAIFALTALLAYLYAVDAYTSIFFVIGLFVFCLLLLTDFIRDVSKMYQSAVKINLLTKLAYTDSLTDLENRGAFIERLDCISPQEKVRTAIMVFDVNGLKEVNDTSGHLAGDAMLKCCAEVLKKLYKEKVGIYRIGGDEFVIISGYADTIPFSDLENRLLRTIEEENKNAISFQLSVAYGYAVYDAQQDNDLFSTFHRADTHMYECKKFQKQLL